MQQPVRPKRARVDELAALTRLHIDPANVELRSDRLCQLFSEHLLAYAVVLKPSSLELVGSRSWHLSKIGTPGKAIELYKSHLSEVSSVPFSALTLEEMVAPIETCGAPEIAVNLRERYLDFSPVHALIDDWEPYAD